MKAGRGSRESTWRVLSRCLAILRRVQEGPATAEELVEAVCREVGPGAYGAARGPALRRRLANDLTRTRRWLGGQIRFDRRTRRYRWEGFDRPWIVLPEEERAALCQLAAQHPALQSLAERIARYLGPGERGRR